MLILIAIVQIIALQQDWPGVVIAIWLGLLLWILFAVFNWIAYRNKRWPKN